MKLLEELKQRTLKHEMLEKLRLEQLNLWFEKYVEQLKCSADLGNCFCILEIPDDYKCGDYVIAKLKENGLMISEFSKFTVHSYKTIYNQCPIDNTGIRFKVSW
jgi:hypothetical protein